MHDWTDGPGLSDDVWVSRLQQADPHWLVLTADLARGGRAGDPRLPAILPAAAVTAVFLTPSVHGLRAAEKMAVVESLLPRLRVAYAGPRGQRYKIQLSTTGEPVFRQWDLR